MKQAVSILLLCLTTSLTTTVSVPLRAQEAEPAIEMGRDALQSRGEMPWYDAKADDLRALNIPPQTNNDFSNRRSRWESESSSSSGTTNTQSMSGLASAFWNVLQVLFWLLVVAILGGLTYLLVRAFINREDSLAVNSSTTFEDSEETDDERIASLPFEVARPRGNLLDEARTQYNAGNFRLAVIYLFSYLLITLDKHQQIRLAKGKTNRQYLGELRPLPELRSIVERTMVSFEDVFFGDHTLTREEFEACWNQLDNFHRRVDEVAV